MQSHGQFGPALLQLLTASERPIQMATFAGQTQITAKVGLLSLLHAKKAPEKPKDDEAINVRPYFWCQTMFLAMWLGLLDFAVTRLCKQGKALSSEHMLMGSPCTCCISLENV